MKTVLIDANNLIIRCVYVNEVIDYNDDKTVNHIDYKYLNYLYLNSIIGTLFAVKNVNEIVLAIDSKNSWRYDIWNRYKEDRKKRKEKDKSKFPWDDFFEHYKSINENIKNNLPIKVLQIDKCEGDDIIGCISLNTNNECHIISTDEDFIQLYCDRIHIYNPLKQKEMKHPNPRMFLAEKCLCGQKKDSIFNIKTPLDYPEGKRKPPFGPKAFEKVVEYGIKQWIIDNNLVDRYKLNKRLIDLSCIPSDIQNNIMQEYASYAYPDPENIWPFFKDLGFPEFIENFTNIENRLLSLY